MYLDYYISVKQKVFFLSKINVEKIVLSFCVFIAQKLRFNGTQCFHAFIYTHTHTHILINRICLPTLRLFVNVSLH